MIDTRELTSEHLLVWFECYQFLVSEAELLDDNRMHDWLELLTGDVRYEVPIRVTRRRGEEGVSTSAWHMKEDFGTLRTRVRRLDSKFAWAEDPPSHTRRFVTNVRCDHAAGDSEIGVKSNVLLYRGRSDEINNVFLAAERSDVLRRTDAGLRLAVRYAVLTHTTLPTQNLGVFV